uniref:Uncharacterized protein n=1 Tax=Arundo donax TaxID=35708 RepID=A0A0A9HH42_ARUDO
MTMVKPILDIHIIDLVLRWAGS